MGWNTPKSFPSASTVSPAYWTGHAVWLGLPLSALPSTRAALISRAHAHCGRLCAGRSRLLLEGARGAGGSNYKSQRVVGWERPQWPLGFVVPRKGLATTRALRVASSLPVSRRGSDAPGRPGQFLGRPSAKGRSVGGPAGQLPVPVGKGKHNVNTGPGEWSSGKWGLRWPWWKLEEES